MMKKNILLLFTFVVMSSIAAMANQNNANQNDANQNDANVCNQCRLKDVEIAGLRIFIGDLTNEYRAAAAEVERLEGIIQAKDNSIQEKDNSISLLEEQVRVLRILWRNNIPFNNEV